MTIHHSSIVPCARATTDSEVGMPDTSCRNSGLSSMVDCFVDLADSTHYMQFQALHAAFTGHCFDLGRHDYVPHDQQLL